VTYTQSAAATNNKTTHTDPDTDTSYGNHNGGERSSHCGH